jgi:quercetin dioxygenase-like cupin family protein
MTFALAAILGAAPKQQKKAGANSRVKLDNELVRVVLADVKPGQKSQLHKHDVNRVMVYLDDGGQQLKFADGTVKDQTWKSGDVAWDPAGGMHTSENTSGKAFRIVEIEIKKPKGEPLKPSKFDAVKVAGSHYRIAFENDQVRVLRVRYAAGDGSAMHEHPVPGLIVYLTDYHMRATREDGKVVERKGDAFDIAMPEMLKHSEKNMRGRFTEMIAVELKTR